MATASRSRASAKVKSQTVSTKLAGMVVADALRTWLIPAACAVVIVVAAAIGTTGVVDAEWPLAVAIFAGLVILAFVALRPLLDDDATGQLRTVGLGLGVAWLAALYFPFHARLFPGTPLVAPTSLTATEGVPLRIPAEGRRSVDLLLEGQLAHAATGAAIPVTYSLTIEGAEPETLTGRFDETLRNQRLGRRGSTVVHQLHVAAMHRIQNAGGHELVVKSVSLEPATAPAVVVSAFADPLPPNWLLAIAAVAVLAVAVVFDARGTGGSTDGALTVATLATLGTAVILWTTDVVHPTFSTLIGSVIFGGAIGFGVGAFAWWAAKRLGAVPAAR